MSEANTKTPLLFSLGLVGIGLLIAIIGGITGGSVLGGLIAGAGVVPAAIAAWGGIQKETQASLAAAIGMVVLSLSVGGILLVLALVDSIF